MALGPGHPTWTMLYDELAELARACGGTFGIYALVVAFAPNGEFPTAFVRARVKRALPKIEALVLSLPPSGGPGSEAAAMA